MPRDGKREQYPYHPPPKKGWQMKLIEYVEMAGLINRVGNQDEKKN